MARNRDQAIVLRRWEWSETSQTAALLARDHGLIRGLAKGARRERSAFSGGLEPLTRGELVWIDRRSTELALLTEWDLREVFPAPRQSLRAHQIALYLAELCMKAIGDADPHPGLWFALLRAARALEVEASLEAPALRFQWAVLTETGAQPELSDDAVASAGRSAALAYDPRAGRVVVLGRDGAADSDGLWRMRADTIALLRAVRDAHEGWRAPMDPDSDAPDRAGFSPALTAHPGTILRANHFLAACLLWALEGDPPTTLDLFLGRPVEIIRRLRRPAARSGVGRQRASPADFRNRR